MCGIVGMFENIDSKSIEEYWFRLEHRGFDSYGFVAKADNKIHTLKSLIDNSILPKIKDFKWIIAHNRWASIGNKNSLKLAHPVGSSGIFVIQNGTKKSLYESIKGAESDTHAIELVYKDLRNKQSIFKYLEKTGVVFIIDTRTDKLIFHKDSSRPLYLNKDLKMFASEPIDVGIWQMIEPQNRVFELSSFDFKSFTKKLSLNNKRLGLENLDYGICEVCEEAKIIEKGKFRCPHCEYTNATPKYITTWNSGYKNWKGGIV